MDINQQQAEILLMLFKAQYADWTLGEVSKKFLPGDKWLIDACSSYIKVSDCTLTVETDSWLKYHKFFVCLEDNMMDDVVEITASRIRIYNRTIDLGDFVSCISFEDKV
jgi:hypothetical protein